MFDRLIVLDTETSGLEEPSGVCEVAWVEFNHHFQIVDKQHSLIDPQVPISPSASGIHHITNAMVADKPTLEEFFDLVLGNPFEGQSVLMVAHNAPFDYKYVNQYLGESSQKLCTLKLARIVYPDAPDHKLPTLKYMLGIAEGASHNALADVEACFGLLCDMSNRTGLDLEGLIRLHNTPIRITSMPFGKHKGVELTKLPRSYISWLLNLDNLDENLRFSLENL